MPALSYFPRKLTRLFRRDPQHAFPGSVQYWDNRYKEGGTSGNGSYGELAVFKADVLNTLIKENRVDSVIEFGCGDGNQLGLLQCPRYTGIDVSAAAIAICSKKYAADPTKRFLLAGAINQYPKATLAMSLDVIYHLVEDAVFGTYIKALFDSAEQYVVIYSSNGNPAVDFKWPPHILHRTFTKWVEQYAPEWELLKKIPNRYPFSRDTRGMEVGSFADFYIFQRVL